MLYIYNYLYIGLFFLTSSALSATLIALASSLGPDRPSNSKLSSYECGFIPFSDARDTFDIHFYVVSLLFMLFDVEVAFILPWAVGLHQLGHLGYFSGLFFIFILFLGLIYEWKKGALN
jgi:NADH-quinone oxidoreductase subunit A